MDTRLLRSFLSVVRAGGITAAAAELGFVQSTITAHVQALERQTGTHLLERLPGGTSPTPAGSLLAERAQEILDLEDRMFAELEGTGRRAVGPVRLCAPESVCAYQLPPLLAALRERHPGIRLSLAPATTQAALAAIIERRADLALILDPSVTAPAVTVADLGRCELSLVAPAATELPRERSLTAAELTAAGVLLLEEGCGYSDDFAALILGTDPAARPARFGSVETVKRCVEAGLGVALLPTATVAAELAAGRLVELRPPSTTPQHLWLTSARSRWTSPAVQAVHEMLLDLAPGRAPDLGSDRQVI